MPVGIYKRTEEHKKKISESHKGKKFSKEIKKKMSESHKGQIPWNKGKNLSEETKKKISISKQNPSKETCEKISKSNKGRIFTKEHKRRLSKARIGKRLSEETKKKISETRLGPNNPAWKGGITCEPYCDAWIDEEYKESIKKRDGYQCQNPQCWGNIKDLVLHHINYIKKDCRPMNLITVCRSCNARANTSRERWQIMYENIIGDKYEKSAVI